MRVSVTCLNCGGVFEALTKEIKRGYGKFCTRSCSAKYNHASRPKILNAECAWCLIRFSKPPSKIRVTKSGLVFCCRKHKDLAQRIGGLEAIQPSHYGRGSYRSNALEHYGETCNRCGFDRTPEILEVHHKDRDRANNELSNLEVVCPSCHQEEHFTAKDGRWARRKAGSDSCKVGCVGALPTESTN